MTTPDDAAAPRSEPRVPLGPVGRYVMENLAELREARRLSYRELSDKLRELGRPIPTLGLSRIEKGTRRVDADDLVALALALDVSPNRLLLRYAAGDEPVDLTAAVTASADRAWSWASGEHYMSPGEASGPVKLSRISRFLEENRPHDGGYTGNDIAELEREHPGLLADVEKAVRAAEAAGIPRKAVATWVRWNTAAYLRSLANTPIPVEEALAQPVATAIVTANGRVLVGRRNDGKPPWTFIAGEVEPGESPADAAVREVKEETGLRVQAGETIGEREHPRTGRTMIYLAAAPTHGTEIFVGDSEELAEVRWVTLAEADELMAAYGMYDRVHEYLARELGE